MPREVWELRLRLSELEKSFAWLREEEERIRRAKNEIEKTFDAVPDLITLIDDNYRIVRVNKAMARKLGLNSQEIVGSHCYARICGNEKPPEGCPFSVMLAGGTIYSLETDIERLGGHYLVTVAPFEYPDGKTGGVHIARNITQRKRAEESLRKSERQLKAILDNIPDIAWLKDRESRFIAVNEPFAKACGRDASDVIGKSDLDIWPSELAVKYRDDDREVMESGKRKGIEEPLIDSKGNSILIETIKTPIYGDGNTVIGTAGIARDITGKRLLEQTQKRLGARTYQEQKERSISTLAGGIAHDFNNILMSVLGNAEMLKLLLPVHSKEHGLADSIVVSSERMAHLTRQLLAYAKSTMGQKKRVGVNDLIHEALALAHKGRALDIEVVLDLGKGLWPITADPAQISQVLLNTITNAFEAMEKGGGRITLRTRNIRGKDTWECPFSGHEHPAGDYIGISISDTGPGIPKDMHKTIFEPFFTTKFFGRGLGLAAVAGIVQSHDGCVSVESEPGCGTQLHLYFPRADGAERTDDIQTALGEASACRPDAFIQKPYRRVLLEDKIRELLKDGCSRKERTADGPGQ
ncbi:MAG: PAS domain-containing protein [Nitrospiraceae bacterium]|nr:PAS domain-containing protein [Nitrospiraceae bacterium]